MIDHSKLNRGIIQTTDACKGCNKCIGVCPVFSANIAVEEKEGGSRVYIDQEKCILCGKCMDTCTHDARIFKDDTQRFFEDLSTGEKDISVVIAPAFIINYPQKYKMVLGYLKSLGVKHIYSVSAGADITIWAYVNYLKNYGGRGVISQPCPVIVNYIERYKPELLERLIPVQSPVMCTAIYLQKYMGVTDELAFISPCIGKKMEIERPQNAGHISYNVTFDHLMSAIGNQDISNYYADGSEIDYGMGALFSTQGGMRENLEYYTGLDKNAYVNQKEGETYSYSYLDLYAARVDYDDPYRAELIDILNCARGCNYGTATEFKNTSSNHIPYFTNKMRVEKRGIRQEEGGPPSLEQRLAALNERFSALDVQDFMLHYDNRYKAEEKVTKTMLHHTFQKMLKFTADAQGQDCSGCGYHSCEEMARAVALGYNHVENCVDYVKKKLVMEQSESQMQKIRLEELRNTGASEAQEDMDQLTGLKNRYGMEKRLEAVLRHMRKNGQMGQLLVIDLDDFMTINKSYGHSFGNALLAEFSNFLKEEFMEEAEVFRIGGDEFCLMMEDAPDARANEAAQVILSRTQEAWELMGARFYCTVSVGGARFPVADESADVIIKNADLAMHVAKKRGKNDFVMYDVRLDTDTNERVDMIRQMRDCIANDFARFEVHYQPWVSAQGEIVGAEALLRWKDDNGEPVSPGAFIPVAEHTGLILSLGEFVLGQAARLCKKINQANPDFMISVNVSVKQFNAPDIFASLYHIVKNEGVKPGNIVLEITESLGIESLSRQKLIMGRFVEAGMQVALDDFGTGYSSLSYLNELPLDLVKIDRSFIKNIESNTYSKDFLATMADLIHKTGQKVCVEGVETKNQLEYCVQAGVDIIQGFYYYKPMPQAGLEAALENHKQGKAAPGRG
ncbi:EAL domain-containing protein [Christensenellaceae bacterium OttesenSCG-928-K19]|nr:EAL domain-containing protein [Christensenellaceae bacterium OttesenSCG-928-K19]